MDPYEIENLRRSLAMLPPNAGGLSREEALRLLGELQQMDRRLRKLREGLLVLVGLATGDQPE